MARKFDLPLDRFTSFGDLLRFLRRRAGLTQRELSIAVGYSESQISRLEQNERTPDESSLAARFVPALGLDREPAVAQRLLDLAAEARADAGPETEAPEPALAASPNNLPLQLTSFIGRAAETAEIHRLLDPRPAREPGSQPVRLLTLTGPGGTGKTRLALEAAVGLLEAYPAGVWLVELGPVGDPGQIPRAVAGLFGLREESERRVEAVLLDFLRARQLLLILDNCEHVVAACAENAQTWLRACPQLRLLATSREILGVPGEQPLYVPSLGGPAAGATVTAALVAASDAGRLFIERATASQPAFALTEQNAPAVAQICRRLDGIPLALELAAARLRVLPVEQIAARLDDALRLLAGGSRVALPRHQTLEALIDWSYALLPEAEQRLLCRLAVFAGGWTLEAAEAVCGGDGLAGEAVLDLLAQLIEKSLVLHEPTEGAGRYRLLETIRQYAAARLVARGEADAMRWRHARYLLTLAESLSEARGTPVPGFAKLEPEHDNLQAVFAFCQSRPEATEIGLRLAVALMGYYFLRGLQVENSGRLEAFLAQPAAAQHPHAQAGALAALAMAGVSRCDYDRAQMLFEQSLAIFQKVGDRVGSAWVTGRLGWLARERGEPEAARGLLEKSISALELQSEPYFAVMDIVTLAESEAMMGDLDKAEVHLDEALRQSRNSGYHFLTGWALNHLGHAALLRGDYDRAAQLQRGAIPAFGLANDEAYGPAWCWEGLGEVALAQHLPTEAIASFMRSLVLFRDLDELYGVAWCLAGLGSAAALDEEPERAAWLWGAGEAMRQALGTRRAPANHAVHARLQAEVREQLGSAAFEAAWAAGAAAPREQAVALALGLPSASNPTLGETAATIQ